MNYVLAQKPEKHNGGVFFEHEIHFYMENGLDRMNQAGLKKFIEEFVTEKIGEKHTDFRVNVRHSFTRDEDGKPKFGARCVVRFTNKNHALRFKLSWPH